MIKIGVIGGSGITGKELIRILLKHSEAKIVYATSMEAPGKKIADEFPEFAGKISGSFRKSRDNRIYKGIDVIFLCVPHTKAMDYVKKFHDNGIKVIDVSADYRIKDPLVYKKWYDIPHRHKNLLKKAVYGLPEVYRKDIKKTDILANPGCYPTSILLGIWPLIRKISGGSIIADSKTGISGAGITPSPINRYMKVNENIIPYNIGRKHRHIGEIEDLIRVAFKKKVNVIFTPQIAPMNYGILSNIYVKVNKWENIKKVRNDYKKFYKGEPFVKIVDSVDLHRVQKTNFCEISINGVKEANTIVITSVIDNVIKGASGQAVQNMNIMFGVKETEGLT